MGGEKLCLRCKEAKPVEAFVKDKSRPSGLFPYCRACNVRHVAKWRNLNPDSEDRIRARRRAQKDQRRAVGQRQCVICREVKDASEFYDDFGRADCTRADCIECAKALARGAYHKNPEKGRASTTLWRQNNPEQNTAYREKYRIVAKDKIAARARAWRLANVARLQEKERRRLIDKRAQIYAKNSRKRAENRESTPSWLTAIHLAQIEEFYELALARTTQTDVKHHVDHIIPLRGKNVRGLHVPWNLQVLTWEENQSKGNKIPYEMALGETA